MVYSYIYFSWNYIVERQTKNVSKYKRIIKKNF